MGKVIPKNVKVAAMKAYVADKKTLREVSVEFGISTESLRGWLGDKVRKRGGRKPGHKHSMRKSEVVEITSSNERKPRVSKLSPVYNRANRRWTDTENELLRDAVLSKMTIEETTELLGRTPASVMCQKSKLAEDGFISDRFVLPTGIKRKRKPITTVMGTPELVADVLVMASEEKPVEPKVVKPMRTTSNIDLADLAKLVKEFGVNVTLNVTAEGMEVKMTN